MHKKSFPRRHLLFILGGLSLACYFWMAHLSRQFNWGEGYSDRPILTYLAIYFCLFALYAGGVALVHSGLQTRWTFWAMVAFGLAFRLTLLPAQQIQEDDVYRYLWDGKVFAHGINPFKYAPDEVSEFKQFIIREPDRFELTYDADSILELARLAQLKWANDTSLVFMERINHPGVATIYPPLAQYVFRAVHHLQPDSILAMRLAFLVFDGIAFTFIVLTLSALGRNRNWSLVYFWCPLVIKETFNSTHLDIIGIAFLCGSIYFLTQKRFYWAIGFLALSVLGKLYPVILLPLYLKEQARGLNLKSAWQGWALSLTLFVSLIVTLYLPFLTIGSKAFAGLQRFSTYWQSNDSIFALLVWWFETAVGLESQGTVGFSYDLPSLAAKITVVIVLLITLAYLLLRKPSASPDPHAMSSPDGLSAAFNEAGRQAAAPAPLPAKADEGTAQASLPEKELDDATHSLSALRDIFIIMALVFLLSPVQNPWYLCWVLPFLCIFPWRSWILLTGLVGLYYLEFYFDYQDMRQYISWIPWFEYLPFYLLLGWEFWKTKKPERAF